MVIDLEKCSACQACVVACKVENNVPCVAPDQSAMGRTMAWMELIVFKEVQGEHRTMQLIPRPCMHCDNPPCIKVCPVGATYKNPEGIVAQIYSRCIGCRYCANNCPYTVKSYNWYEPKWSKEIRETLNPDVSLRYKGVVEKCTFCHHRLIRAREEAKAQGRELVEGDYVPACVEICPSRAMAFGDLDDPNSAVASLSRSVGAFRLMEDLGTQPKVFYLAERESHA